MRTAEILYSLQARDAAQEALFERARMARATYLGDEAVLRGVIEVTDACRVDCDYCPMRRSNRNDRYLMRPDEIVEVAKPIKAAGLRVVFLQGGETPATTRTVGEAIPRIKDLFADDMEVLLCLGNKTREEYAYLRAQGADSYILKHETSDPRLHQQLRHDSLASRLDCLQTLLDLGYRVGTGMIAGLPGQSQVSLAIDIQLPRLYGTHMASCSPFIPAVETPLATAAPGDIDLTLNAMALLRIENPTLLIPSVSALEKLQKGGQLAGLQAGANVITINFTPEKERRQYRIYGRDRFIVERDHALRTVEAAGLHIA